MRLHSLHELDDSDGTAQLHVDSSAPSGSTQQFYVTTAESVVLVPRPSDTDPNDPLRWPKWKKHIAFTSVCAFSFLTNYAIGGLAPAFFLLSLEFNKTMTETSALLVWPILVLGAFNFFWVPIGNYFGKRPVFVFTTLLLTVCYIWGATASSFHSLLWSNIIAAFAGSASEALGASIVNDLYFLHERGSKMAIYMNAIAGGNTVGPLFCGFVLAGLSWRWHKWIAVILTGLNFLGVLFFVPETRYYRDETSDPAKLNTTPAEALSDKNSSGKNSTEGGMLSPTTAVTRSSSAEKGSTRANVPRKTYMEEISLWSGVAPNTNLVKMFARPFPMIVYPCVIYAFLGYAVPLVLTVAVNILNSFVLQALPYSWSPLVNGLINIPGLLGNLFGAYAGGPLVDRYSSWRARQNHGVFEPESRLWLLILPTLITGAGCLVFGYGVEHTLHWTSLFFGYGMVSFALTAVPTITMTYVSDCLLPINSDALMLVNGKFLSFAPVHRGYN
jgi:MFS family permease